MSLPLTQAKTAEFDVALPRINSMPEFIPSMTEEVMLLPPLRIPSQKEYLSKRIVDVSLATLAIVMLLPMLIVIMVAIKASSSGPIFYRSNRIGKNYQPFKMWKFRTMVHNADKKRDALRKDANLTNNLFKMQNDPRVTTVGKLLRSLSLDELPQLINVLKGEMSLVGPRPLPPDESRMFEAPYTARYLVLPGITGAWQVSGRSTLDFKTLCKLELDYIYQWTFWQDIRILAKTVPAVLSMNGAY